MPRRTSTSGSELFIVDNSDQDWKVLKYLHDWCQISKALDIATGYFEIGSLLGLKDEWQKVDRIRILMGDEVSMRTREAFAKGLEGMKEKLDASIESEKQRNDFLSGVPAIVAAIRSGKIACRVYRKEKFHAKAYITHARLEVVGSSALVGSSNFTVPGLTENVELNVQITGGPVTVLQEWYEQHWNEAEDVTPEILKVIERHVREYSPFEVYARSMHEFFRRHEMTDREWLEKESKVYGILDKYQQEGFHDLMHIAGEYRGGFLCDGVGLGKTFIGLMVIEYLVKKQRRKVLLLVPKAAREPVWEAALRRYLPKLLWPDSNLLILNHTDLGRKKSADVDYPPLWEHVREEYDSVVIDEAHHFRNPGLKGEEGGRQSRYWQMFDIAKDKQLFMLTATPVNNRLIDLQHMMELFTQRKPDYFKEAPLGIHSLPGHFRKMEKELERLSSGNGEEAETNQVEADKVLSNDSLFRALVVQRSRGYVKRSQQQQPGGAKAIFPKREDPKVGCYRLKKTYGKLLDMIDKAFSKEKPLFSLAVYYPLAYYKGPDKSIDPMKEGRQEALVRLIRTQFLKRFESSVRAFEMSCDMLLDKLKAWLVKNKPAGEELRRFERWQTKYAKLLGLVEERQRDFWGQDDAEKKQEEDAFEELVEEAEELNPKEYKVSEIINETIDDLGQIAEFLEELEDFKPERDDKLQALIRLLKSDLVLKEHKVLVFSEYMATARYLEQQLKAAGVEGVNEVDSARAGSDERGLIIKRFSPYYNGSSSSELAREGLSETRVLVSTDVLSEGLNLQDATRLINYDLHWNPVRLMQRIGRVDRRMNFEDEARLLRDHPEQKEIRGTVAYWNFLPPGELDDLLRLYARVAHKTLCISKTFGIEGKKLLKPEDDYEALRDFTHAHDSIGHTPFEDMRSEYNQLFIDHPGLLGLLEAQPNRVFSGKEHPKPGSRAVFFCYAMPEVARRSEDMRTGERLLWTEESSETKWYLFDLAAESVADDPTEMVKLIRCPPETPRRNEIPGQTLSEIRAKVEKHIKDTYLKQVQAPAGAKPVLKAWMELS